MRPTWLERKLAEQVPAEVNGAEISIDEIIQRMKKEFEVKTDKELGEILNVSKTAVSSWRNRNSIPLDVLVSAAVSSMCSMDYLVFGKTDSTPSMYESGIDIDLLEVCVYALDKRDDKIEWEDDPDGFRRSSCRARSIALNYAKCMALQKEAIATGKVTKFEFIASLKNFYDARDLCQADGERSGN